MTGAGLAAFTVETVFVAEFIEVRAGRGVRPRAIRCQRGAAVVGTVTGGNSRQRVPDAQLTSSGSALSPDHPMTAVTGTDGTYQSFDPHRHSSVPARELTVVAGADRYQDTAVTVNVPEQGRVIADVFMPCTEVQGIVVEQIGSSRLPPTGSRGRPRLPQQRRPASDSGHRPGECDFHLRMRAAYRCAPFDRRRHTSHRHRRRA